MRQFLLRLVLLFLAVLVIFGLYRLLTIRPLEDVAFFQDLPPLVAVDSAGAAGSAAYSPDAFQAAREAGANALYLPVHLTRDGVLVVTADPVNELTLAELRAQPAAADSLALQEALTEFPDLRAIVDVRQPSLQALAALMQVVDASAARTRVLALVDDPLLVSTLRQQAPDLATAATTAETNAFLTMQRLRLTPFYRPAAPAMLLEGDRIDKRLVRGAGSRGIHLLALPQASSGNAVQTLIDTGVDGVVVTDPAVIAGLRWPGQAP